MPQQRHRRAVRPVQVLQDQQHGAVGGELGEQSSDGLEESPALGVSLLCGWVGRFPPHQHGEEAGKLRPTLRDDGASAYLVELSTTGPSASTQGQNGTIASSSHRP